MGWLFSGVSGDGIQDTLLHTYQFRPVLLQCNAIALVDHLRYVHFLFSPDVIECQKTGMGLSTIHTGVSSFVGFDILPCLLFRHYSVTFWLYD